MRKLHALPLVLGLALCATPSFAQARGVGLGVGAGIAVPDSGNVDFDPAFNWGFFVDIPLISTFHITPSTLIYELAPEGVEASRYVTDVSLNFKFIIPLGPIEPFAGVTAGLTAAGEIYPHAGLLAGVSINLVSNLDLFVQANYKLVIVDENNVRDLQIYAGPLFRFY